MSAAMEPRSLAAERLTRLNGNPYLEVKWRLAWFRAEYPNGQVETDIVDRGPDWVIFRASVRAIGEGGVLCGSATGHSYGAASEFQDYLEKCESAAIGRALAALGFGTQFVVNHEDDAPRRVVDAPVPMRQERREPRPAATPKPAPAETAAAEVAQPTERDTMTARQKSYLEAVARAAGFDANQLDDLAVQRFTTPYRWLSRQHASALITELQQRQAAS